MAHLMNLESRLQLSAALSLNAGVLYVHATDSAAIAVTVGYADAAKSRIRVTSGGNTLGKPISSAAVTRVVLEGSAAADRLAVDSSAAAFDKPVLILGSAGNDTLIGGAANDALLGGAGRDQLYGGAGDDALFGGTENDTILGEAGNDYIFGALGSDNADGGAGLDTIMANNGPDTVSGGDGSDNITVPEVGRADGGPGDDGLSVVAGSTAVVLGGAGNNQIYPISAGQALRRLKRTLSAQIQLFELNRFAVRQI